MLTLVNVIIRLMWSHFIAPFSKAYKIKKTGYCYHSAWSKVIALSCTIKSSFVDTSTSKLVYKLKLFKDWTPIFIHVLHPCSHLPIYRQRTCPSKYRQRVNPTKFWFLCFFWFSIFASAFWITTICFMLQTLKLNNKKRKTSSFYEEKSLVGLTQGFNFYYSSGK
jgi:hypothetical protein